jgi:hypothetical protein
MAKIANKIAAISSIGSPESNGTGEQSHHQGGLGW